MGQRSQIYVKITDKEGKRHFIAKYFQWNYGERMISRTRHTIEYIKKQLEYIGFKNIREQISNILNINFDMKDYLLTTDIIQNFVIYLRDYETEFKNFVFYNQGNNDGKLFIDIKADSKEIKYCLTDDDLKIFNSPKAYMDWDCMDWESSKYYSQKERNTCLRNIKYIENKAILMTQKELEEFINDDYTEVLKEKKEELLRLKKDLEDLE